MAFEMKTAGEATRPVKMTFGGQTLNFSYRQAKWTTPALEKQGVELAKTARANERARAVLVNAIEDAQDNETREAAQDALSDFDVARESENLRRLSVQLCDMVSDWDAELGGQPLPLEPDAVAAAVPVEIIQQIFKEIEKAQSVDAKK